RIRSYRADTPICRNTGRSDFGWDAYHHRFRTAESVDPRIHNSLNLAMLISVSGGELDLCCIALYFNYCSKRSRRIGKPLKDVPCLIACSRLGQTAGVQELIIHMPVVSFRLPLADLVEDYRSKRNGLQVLSLIFEISDHAFVDNCFGEHTARGRKIKDEVSQVVEDGFPFVNLNAVQKRSTVHHDDICASIDFFMS